MSGRLASRMTEMRRAAALDLRRSLRGPTSFLLTVAGPAVLVLLAGLLPTQPDPVAVLVAGTASAPTSIKSPDSGKLLALLRESGHLTVASEAEIVIDPLSRMHRDAVELLLNLGEGETGDWSLYTAETDPARLEIIGRAAAGIERVISALQDEQLLAEAKEEELPALAEATLWEVLGNLDVSYDPSFAESWPATEEWARARLLRLARDSSELMDGRSAVWWRDYPLFDGLASYGVLPKTPLFEYYPAAADRRVRHLPTAMALMLCLLPFLLASASFGTARETSDLPAPLGLIARSAAPVAISFSSFLLMLVLSQTAFQLQVKGGVVQVLLLALPTLFGCASLGLAVAWLCSSLERVMLATGLFALVCFVPVATGVATSHGSWGTAAAWLGPAVRLQELLNSWCFGVPAAELWSADGLVAPLLFAILGWLALARAPAPRSPAR